MKIVQITPGTGNFHCGACLRDQWLAKALSDRGHKVLIAPLYLPMVLEEPLSVAKAPMFFGGINVFLQQKSVFFRKTPRWLDRLFDRPGLLRWTSRFAGMTRARDLGEMTVSMLRGEQGLQKKELERLVVWLEAERPDVVMLSNALLLGLARRIKESLEVPVVVALQGEDVFLDSLPAPYREQAWRSLRERAGDADLLLGISRYYGEAMSRRLGLPEGAVQVVWNGAPLDDYMPAEAPPNSPAVGYLARMCPEKGLDILVEAFLILKRKEAWRSLKLRVAGARTPSDEPFVKGIRSKIEKEGFSGDVAFFPNLNREEKLKFLQSLSVFSVPAAYDEAFGLYVIEALACGTPVVEPRRGALPELIEATGGGILCEPDDPASLAEGVGFLLSRPEEAREMGRRGRAAVLEKFAVAVAAEEIERLLVKAVAGS